MWPGPSIITCTSCAQARVVSSPSVSSSANWARSFASATERAVDDLLSDRVAVAPRGEIHHRVRPLVDGVVQLLELLVDVRLDGRVADVGVDLHAGHLADRHRIEPLREVTHIRGNDEPPASDLVAHLFDRERFALCDALHLGGDGALTGEVHLRDAAHTRVSLTETGAESGERYPTVQTALPLRTGVNRSLLPAPRIRQSNLTGPRLRHTSRGLGGP